MIRRKWQVFLYFMSWFWFAVFGLGLNLACLPLFLYPNSERRARLVRSTMRRLFGAWLFWFRLSGIIRITWKGFEGPLPGSRVYVANHPCLLDATFLLAKIPDAFCIFKPQLLRNPCIGLSANMAGFVSGDNLVGMVHDAAARVSAGGSLLIFPEGTRTAEVELLGSLKPGAALIAERARVPVQLLFIRTSQDLVPKGRPWWSPPAQLPARLEITLGPCLEYDPDGDARTLLRRMDKTLREGLASGRRVPEAVA